MRAVELDCFLHCCQRGTLGWRRRCAGGNSNGRLHGLTPEERARVTDIQDLLIERCVEQKEALEEGKQAYAGEIEFEIKKLREEIEKIKEWANV